MCSITKSPDEHYIDLWYVCTKELLAADAATQVVQCLSSQEIEASKRFLSKRDADAYLLAHAMLRVALSHYFEATPASFEFQIGRYGKPSLCGQFAQQLDFSLSHTAGIAVCAVTKRGKVGVDVEGRHRDRQMLDIARRHFSASEIHQLQRLEPTSAADSALELWALKESFLKALGTGLQLPLNSFSIKMPPTGPPMLASENALHESPELWRFFRLSLNETFLIAIAHRFGDGTVPSVSVRQLSLSNLAFEAISLESNPNLQWVL